MFFSWIYAAFEFEAYVNIIIWVHDIFGFHNILPGFSALPLKVGGPRSLFIRGP